VDFYRKAKGVKLAEITERAEDSALKRGFAVRENRVAALDTLAATMYRELTTAGADNKLWLKDVKAVGSGDGQTIVDFEQFNAAEVQQFRGVLDDLAKEVGDRKTKLEHTGKDGTPLMQPLAGALLKIYGDD